MHSRGRKRNSEEEVPEDVINNLLGRGYDAQRWQAELEYQGYTWRPCLKNIIIGKQFLFFKDEIGHLLSEPVTRRGDNTRSNSCKSVLEMMRGETGLYFEKDQRVKDRLLFGPESSLRTLENYVKQWREAEPCYGLTSPPAHSVQSYGTSTGNHHFLGTLSISMAMIILLGI